MLNIKDLCMGCMCDNNGEDVCSVCAFDATHYCVENALPLRTVLANRYVVGKVISENGEGFTYLGYDSVAACVVHIHEYFPTGLCQRVAETGVEIGEDSFSYNEGLLQFVELYKTLGSLNEVPVLFKVIDIFETNKTAYTVTEHQPGISLQEFLLRNGGLLSWEQARPLFVPLISALETLHGAGLIHGAISPETLMVGRDGKMRLSGFCINNVRLSGNEMVPELYSGYAAVEQYDGTALEPATDIYAFAATLFRTITGNSLSEAVQRREHDNLNFPRAIAEKTPRGVLVAMANALQIEKEQRTAQMQQFKEDLNTIDPTVEEKAEQKEKNKKAGKAATRKYTLIAAVATAVVLCAIFGIAAIVQKSRSNKELSSSSQVVTSTVSIGDIGNSSVESKFSVPDFTGKTVSSLLENEEYAKWFSFTVVKKEYNSKVEKGKICGQSVNVGTAVSKDTKVELTVSLGSSEVTLPKKLAGKTRTEAYITLLEMGFDPDNIQFIEKKGDPTEEEVVISTSPDLGKKVSLDSAIIVYYNTNIVVSEPENSDTENVENNLQMD